MAVRQLSDGGPAGATLGQSSTDLICFHGGTPTSRRAAAALSASLSVFIYTGASIMATGTLTNTVASLVDAVNEIKTVFTAYNLHKGGA